MQEKHGSFKGTGIWKIPTGIVEEVCALDEVPFELARILKPLIGTLLVNFQGEDIFIGATREVKEETGVRNSLMANNK